MKYGFVLPTGDARTAADLAYEAEQAGWDGFFVYETVWGVDAWVSLAAAAMRTERIRLGTDITPLSRMRPWKLASETATLDNLSNGRVILAVGLGALDTGFAEFGEATDRKTRAELLDEGLDILTGLWRGQPFSYEGRHYQIKPTTFPGPPPLVQQPRIPIWAVGAWPRPKSMRRVLRCDGIMPAVIGDDGQWLDITPDHIREIGEFVAANRAEPTPFDIVMEGETPGDDATKAAAITRRWADAGATWWIESRWQLPRDADGLKIVRERIGQGPPRLRDKMTR
jgi:alkanesulfonate monooxygenase SsuD/methylene tetrahydromethanopterin reductase-like flavin-dependent oxidoreductase (luciferase family)